MTYKEKMRKHLQQAEACDVDVTTFDNWADRTVEADPRARRDLEQARSKGNRDSIKHEKVSALLSSEPLYRSRASARDHHVRMATMYGIAMLVQLVDGDTP